MFAICASAWLAKTNHGDLLARPIGRQKRTKTSAPCSGYSRRGRLMSSESLYALIVAFAVVMIVDLSRNLSLSARRLLLLITMCVLLWLISRRQI